MLYNLREELIVSLAGVDTTRMLEFWRWLVPDSLRPLFATALGDLFLADPAGTILWLDSGVGRLRTVAANTDEFRQAVADPENATYWFGGGLVDQLRAAGKLLLPMECYSYHTLPMLGGRFEPTNFQIYPVVRHFRALGQIHDQLKDLPDGAVVEFKVVE